MLTRILLNYSKPTLRNSRFFFSQAPKSSTTQASTKTQQQEPKAQREQTQQPPKEQPISRRPNRDDDFGEQEEPELHKQNRNTIGWWIYRFFFWGTFSILSYNTYIVYTNKSKTRAEDLPGAVPGFIDVAKSLVRSVNDSIEFITQPTSKKLLYDPVHPDLHPKTLILNLTGTIMKSQYIFGKGMKITLRPGLEQMLRRLSQKYEIVIFAQEDEYTIMNKIMKIDPKQMHIRGVLGREAMVWKNGEFIKDLRYLNRDLRKVIVIDRSLDNVKNHPENTIVLPQFDGSQTDNELNKLAVLLDKMVDVPDVRKYLKSLGDNPVETYYARAKQVQERINKKASMFGVFGKPQ